MSVNCNRMKRTPNLPLVSRLSSRWCRRSCSEDYPSPQAMSTILCSDGTPRGFFYSPGSSPVRIGLESLPRVRFYSYGEQKQKAKRRGGRELQLDVRCELEGASPGGGQAR